MPNRLEKLTISKFRGGTTPVEIDFDPTKSIAFIFGENGTGKSTIADALEFGLTGDIGSLCGISLPTPRKHGYLPSIGSNPSGMSVTVTFGGTTWRARMNKSKPEITGPDDRPRVHVLRRADMLQLITAEPKKRYEALQPLIAVRHIETTESELRDAFNAARSDTNKAIERRTQAERTLQELWKQSGDVRATSAIEWARAATTADLNELKANLADARGLLKASTDVTTAWSELQTATANANDADSRMSALVTQMETIHRAEDAATLDVLQRVQHILEGAETCPVCEQPISVDTVRRRVADRLAALSEVSQLKLRIDQTTKTSERHASFRSQQSERFESRRAILAQRIEALRGRFLQLPVALNFESESTAAICVAQIEGLVSSLQIAIEADEKTLHQQQLLATNVASVDETIRSLVELQERQKRLEKVCEIVQSTRKDYVSEVLKEISETAATMYARLHPEETIGAVSLYLKDGTSGSLELTGSFAGQTSIPPQAYYSESHLDTLGLCVFLATAQRDPGAIAILDDVFTSVDDAHLSRVLELLHDESDHFAHLVITTHYRAWRDRYRYAHAPAAQPQLIELLRWTESRGIRHTKTSTSADELRDLLAKEPLDRIGVANRAGILLEALLDELTLRYRCRMPRAADLHYTLGELIGGIDSKLMKALRVVKPAGEISLEPLLHKALTVTYFRNQVGAHFNLHGSNISDSDVQSFGEATLAFAQAITCESCGEVPRREKSGEHWQCTCGKTRLLPLVKPGDKV